MDAITNNDYSTTSSRKYNFVTLAGEPVDVGTPTEPVTLAEQKAHMRVDFSDDDTYITALIVKCRRLFERATGVGIVSKTVTAEVRNELGNVVLPYWPVTSITSATDEYGVVFTNYEFYHTAYLRTPTATKSIIVYVTTAMATVPADMKMSIMELITYHYVHRGDGEVTQRDYQNVLNDITAPFKRGTWLL